MIPSAFTYCRASTIEEAVRLISENDDAKLLAGGHSLVPAMKLRMSTPNLLVDIGNIEELRGIQRENGALRLGANATHREVESAEPVQRYAPALAQAASVVGDVRVAFNGIGNAAFRDHGVEQALAGKSLTLESVRDAAHRAAEGVDLMEDQFADEAYRRHLATVFARRALEKAGL